MSSTDLTSTGLSTGTIIAILGTYLVVVLIIAVVWLIANWKIFTKMDEAGWKCIIPIYNQYILFKKTWNTKMFWIMLVVGLAGGIFQSAVSGNAGQWLYSICTIVSGVILIMQLYYQSRSFGHGAGFTVGLVFLNTIFVLILAFGKSEYIGNTTEEA